MIYPMGRSLKKILVPCSGGAYWDDYDCRFAVANRDLRLWRKRLRALRMALLLGVGLSIAATSPSFCPSIAGSFEAAVLWLRSQSAKERISS